MIFLLIILAVVLLLAGFEMLLVLGVLGLATKTVFYDAIPDPAFIQKALGGIDHSTLMAIPFFIYAAQLMGSGQIARRLTGFVKALVGHTNGGMGYTVIGGSMAFGSVSGSAPATVAAMGRMAYPEMRSAGFSDKFSLGLLVASAETSLLIPPSITLIVYGWMTGSSIARLFAGGLAVGLVLGLAFAVLVKLEARHTGIASQQRTSIKEKLDALKAAGWALGMPVIILGGIYGGVFTPTEAAAASVVYAIFTFLQELVTRGVIQGTLMRFLGGKHVNLRAILLSTMVFAISHMHLPSPLFAASVILPSFFWGAMYARQKSLFGVTLSHVIIGLWFTQIMGFPGTA